MIYRRSLETGYVPAAPFMKRVRRYVAYHDKINGLHQTQIAAWTGLGGRARGEQMLGTTSVLASKIGIKHDLLLKWMSGRTQFIPFDDADKLLCEMNQVWAWQEDPRLNRIYWKVNLLPLDEPKRFARQWKAKKLAERAAKEKIRREAVAVPKKFCAVIGCKRSHYAHGWCRMHYERVQKTGDPGPVGLLASSRRKDESLTAA